MVHRNPNVQMFALELANSLFQNCSTPLHLELSSRAWTSAMERLITDRTTLPQVKTKAVGYVKSWWSGLKGGPAEGVMGDLVESLKAKNIPMDAPAPGTSSSVPSKDDATKRASEEDAELQRVLELSKQDQGGRSSGTPAGASSSDPRHAHAGPSGGSMPPSGSNDVGHRGHSSQSDQQQQRPFPAREPTPPPMPTRATASRVRAIYPFVTHEQGELSFEKDDVIKVIDRMYDEWYTGAVGGRIGIFPISYVEPLPEPTPEELRREAQEEAKVFAAEGLIVSLQRMLDGLDPTRGDKVDDPELEAMYQRVVQLQPQIVALMKKYADQRAELEHIHMGFIKASRQYQAMAHPQSQPAQQQQHMGYGYPQSHQPEPHRQGSYGSVSGANPTGTPSQADQHAAAWAAYYAQVAAHQQQQQQQQQQHTGEQPLAQHQQAQVTGASQGQGQTQEERDQIAAAWQAYYAAQAQAAAAAQAHQQPEGYAQQPDGYSQQQPAQATTDPAYPHAQPQASPGPYHQPHQPSHQSSYPSQPLPADEQGSLPNPHAASRAPMSSGESAYPQDSAPQQFLSPGPQQQSGAAQPSPPLPTASGNMTSPPPVAPKPASLQSPALSASQQTQQPQYPNPYPASSVAPHSQGQPEPLHHRTASFTSNSGAAMLGQASAPPPPPQGSMPGLERAASHLSIGQHPSSPYGQPHGSPAAAPQAPSMPPDTRFI